MLTSSCGKCRSLLCAHLNLETSFWLNSSKHHKHILNIIFWTVKQHSCRNKHLVFNPFTKVFRNIGADEGELTWLDCGVMDQTKQIGNKWFPAYAVPYHKHGHSKHIYSRTHVNTPSSPQPAESGRTSSEPLYIHTGMCACVCVCVCVCVCAHVCVHRYFSDTTQTGRLQPWTLTH